VREFEAGIVDPWHPFPAVGDRATSLWIELGRWVLIYSVAYLYMEFCFCFVRSLICFV